MRGRPRLIAGESVIVGPSHPAFDIVDALPGVLQSAEQAPPLARACTGGGGGETESKRSKSREMESLAEGAFPSSRQIFF